VIKALLAQYLKDFPNELILVDSFLDFLDKQTNAYSRQCSIGHVTASAIILNQDLTQVVLMEHKKLSKWLQPGGHADGDTDLERVARKEAFEEVGLKNLLPEKNPSVIGLSIHTIPQRNEIPEHLHYDVRFAFRSLERSLRKNEESLDAQWFAIGSLEILVLEEELMRHVARAVEVFR